MKCIHIPAIPYGEFSKKFQDGLGNRRFPLSGSIEITARCNLRCLHCYINLPANDRISQKKELTGPEWRRLIDEMVDAGCLWLLLTGGEPFLRPDFLDIYTYAKKKGLFISLFTNGTLVTPAIADHLAAWRPFEMEISIYGGTRETFEAVTKVPGSYDRCLRGIHLLRERKINLTLKTMVLTVNQPELALMKRLARDLGVSFRYDAVISPRVDGSRAPYAFRLAPEMVVELDLDDEERLKAWADYLDNFLDFPDSDDLYVCDAGFRSFHIDPYGSLSVCMMARHPCYPLSQGSFKEGWEEFIPEVRSQKRQHDNPCSQCRLLTFCEQCPGWSQLEHGNQEQLVEYLCRIAHLRAEVFAGRHAWRISHENQEAIS